MTDIVRIVIKGESGYGPYEAAYEEKISISADTIRYEYNPKVQGPNHLPHKWSYKTTSPAFFELFRNAALAVEEILDRTEEAFACDIGMTAFSIRYSDKTRKHREFFSPADDFKECFMIIKQMVPGCEEMPAVLIDNL